MNRVLTAVQGWEMNYRFKIFLTMIDAVLVMRQNQKQYITWS